MARYTLGDTEMAGNRLAVLAEVFGPSTEAFVSAALPSVTDAVVDLGCGTGHTTAMLARLAGARSATGLDTSTDFLRRARAAHPSLEFQEADVTRVPLPVDAPDVIFARFVLAHLPDPMSLVADWVAQLAPAGRLLIEEGAGIESTVATFRTYQRIVHDMIASCGADLYVGRTLGVDRAPGVVVVHADLVELSPPTAVVARLFAMNLATWRHDPWVMANVSALDIDRLAAGLDELAESEGCDEIVFRNRQVAYERAPAR
jgi:SAM-dependent methyltransferase